MTENKTQPNDISIEAFLASIENPERQADSRALAALMQNATGQPPVLWGTSIIGFGKHHYLYDSGRSGDTVAVGFAPRKAALVIYGLAYLEQDPARIQALGTYTMGKGCVYVKRLKDVEATVLSELVKTAFDLHHNA
jgi:hypothetical protein